MANWISKKNIICIFIFFSFLISEDIYLSKIEVEGIVTATKNQIYRNIGLYPSETFVDINNNGIYDIDEKYIDENFNNKFDKGSLISNENSQIDFERFSLAIKSLLRLKVFSDVQFYVTGYYDNFVDIKIVVEEFPVLKEVNFIGCDKIKESTLLEKINLLKMQRLSNDDIIKAKNIIIDEYKSKNYHNIMVDYELQETDDLYSKSVLFKIIEGKKLKIKKINFIGNNNFSKSKLLKNFSNTSERKWYKFWKGKYVEQDFNDDIKKIETFYKDNGYRDMQVINKEVQVYNHGIEIEIFLDENEISFFKIAYFR